MIFRKGHLLLFFLFYCHVSYSQFDPLIKNILRADTFNTNNTKEKIFVHYDKPYYNTNDTLWLKGYILNAKDCDAALNSKIAYIDIFDAYGHLVKRTSAYCAYGLFFANITLDENRFIQGRYVLRAYTNHMRNYGDSLFFESPFTVINPSNGNWNVAVHTLQVKDSRLTFSGAMLPDANTNTTSVAQNVSILVKSKNKIIYRQDVVTNTNNQFFIDTVLNSATISNDLLLEVRNDKNFRVALPVHIAEENKLDLQFLPEGGSFIANKLQQLGFKAINNYGKGIAVKGRIESSKKQVIATFASVHNGMGTVWLQPEANEKYTAILDNGATYALPMPQVSGVQMQVINKPNANNVALIIDASPDLMNKPYYFVATARGVSCAMGAIRIVDKPKMLSIPKDAFPSGVCKFTLYNSDYVPINERAILIWHRDSLNLQLTSQKSFYSNRDSVQIQLIAKSNDNTPSLGSFSVSVIDTSLIPYARYGDNIVSNILLSSDVKGYIEEPAYYFDNPLPEAIEALMLTQAWVKYNHYYTKPSFEYENEFAIKGKIKNLFNNPVANGQLILFGKLGKAPPFVSLSEADKNGNFTFTGFPRFENDSLRTVIRGVNKRGKSFGIEVDVIEPSFPAYSNKSTPYFSQNIMYDEKTKLYAQKQTAIYNQLKKERGDVEDIVVKSKSKVKGSKNVNKDGAADQIIGSTILDIMPKKTVYDIIRKEVEGLHIGRITKPTPKNVYKDNSNIVVFIIDGVDVLQDFQPLGFDGIDSQFVSNQSENGIIEYYNTYLKNMLAEEVVGIEVMNTLSTTTEYKNRYMQSIRNNYRDSTGNNFSDIALSSFTFIEITTYSGNGAYYKNMPGMNLYRPAVVPIVAKAYYTPRYNNSQHDVKITDKRATIYWKPDMLTNKNGEASFSFYTNDNKAGALVIVQGTDLKGRLGIAYLPVSSKTPLVNE